MNVSLCSRRGFLKALSLGGAAVAMPRYFCLADAEGSPDHAPGRPNILWIVIDDIGPDLGCFGNRLVTTPNLDQFAKEGVRFPSAFATCPVCSPSRSAFSTGMYQTTIGAQDHRSAIGRLPEGTRAITDYLLEAGYWTVNIESDGQFKEKKILGSSGKTDWNFTPGRDPFTMHSWDVNHPEQIFTGEDWNKRKAGQPFFAYVNIETAKAHGFGDGRRFAKEQGISVHPEQIEVPPYYPDTPQMRDRLGQYYDAVSHLDFVVGEVLKGLKEAGLEEKTLVFFFSDHGRAMMRHKQWLYDGGIHVPLIVRWPGKIKPDSVREDLVSLIDVMPTTLRAAGIEAPARMEGRHLFGGDVPPREYIFAARDRCDNTFDRVRCVRTQRYKYIRNFHPELPYTQESEYATGAFLELRLLMKLKEENKLTPEQALFMAPRKPPEELYDLQADPYEVKNLADVAEHKEILLKLI